MANCEFCAWRERLAESPGGAIYEDDLVLARHAYDGAGEASYLGALVLQPKRHATLAELTDDEARAMGWLAARLGRALAACTSAEKVYAYAFGEAYDHLHMFVVARYPGAPAEYVRLRAQEWPAAPRGDERTIAALVERLRASIGDTTGPRADGEHAS